MRKNQILFQKIENPEIIPLDYEGTFSNRPMDSDIPLAFISERALFHYRRLREAVELLGGIPPNTSDEEAPYGVSSYFAHPTFIKIGQQVGWRATQISLFFERHGLRLVAWDIPSDQRSMMDLCLLQGRQGKTSASCWNILDAFDALECHRPSSLYFYLMAHLK